MKREILRQIFVFFLFALFATYVTAQESRSELKGVVIDEKGEALIGATIRVDGTTVGASTDLEGHFKLNLPKLKKIVLHISSVGYKNERLEVAKISEPLRIQLHPASTNIDEVVVIGYGTAKRSSLTSSVEVISGDELTKIPAMNVDQSLAGQVAGLGVMAMTGDPSSGAESKMAIRGNNGNPLLVIDGVPRLGTNTGDGEMRLSDLNPDDIESVSILKDAAAAAVYGARAANGVILVQTKRGKEGIKTRVNFRGQFNLQQATYLPKFLDSNRFAELYNRAIAESESSVYTPIDVSLLGSNPNLYGNENLLDYLDKWGHSQRYSLSVSSGTKSVRYFISGGYTNTKGLYSNVGRDRFNYSAKIDADLMPGLAMSVDLNGTVSSNKNSSYTTVDAAYSYSPLQVLRFTDGQLASIDGSNPLVNIEGIGGYNKVNTDYHTLNAQLRYQIPGVKGLQTYLKGTVDMNHQNTVKFNKPVALYIYDPTTGQTNVDPKTIHPVAKVSYQDQWQTVNNMLLEWGVNYDRTFAERHAVTALLVANYQDYSNHYLSGLNPNLAGESPEVVGSTSSAQLNGNKYYSQRASLVGRATYGYESRYFAEFSFRLDGSTRFAPGRRWGFFPTLSGSWVISNEEFFEAIRNGVISFAKLRASAGILGDDGGVSDYSYLRQYMYSPGAGYPIGGSYAPGVIPASGSYPNEFLQWGKSKDWNLGVDLGFFNNRLNLTAEVYQRYRTNLITGAPAYLFPPSVGTGGSVPSVNIGKIRYQGCDLQLKHSNTVGNFKYTVGGNVALSTNRVLDYGDESAAVENLRRQGKSYLVWSLYESAGLFQSMEEIMAWPVDQDGMGNATLRPGDIKYLDKDGNGVLSNNDRVYVRNGSQPDLNYGITLNGSYKGIYLTAQFQGVAGYNQQITELYTLESRSLPRFQEYHYTNSWTPENPNAEYPRVKFASSSDNNRLPSTFWVRECDFLRLKALTVGYRFPTKMLRSMRLSSLDVALQGGNLFTISSLDNMDPESLRGYPLQRTYGLTLNLGL